MNVSKNVSSLQANINAVAVINPQFLAKEQKFSKIAGHLKKIHPLWQICCTVTLSCIVINNSNIRTDARH